MSFNPDVHHRRSIRLRDYDYSCAGAYFVTLCAFQRECLFGNVVEGAVQLNDMGRMVKECWDAIPNHFPHCELDESVVMPNHFHGVIFLSDHTYHVGAQHAAPEFGLSVSKVRRAQWTRAQHAAPLHEISPARNVAAGSLGTIIRSFKSAVTKRINIRRNKPGAPVWQRNYYERVLRDDHEFAGIRRYIADNPAKWAEDENHPARQSSE